MEFYKYIWLLVVLRLALDVASLETAEHEGSALTSFLWEVPVVLEMRQHSRTDGFKFKFLSLIDFDV